MDVQPLYHLSLAKIVPYIAMIVSRLSVLHVAHAVMTRAAVIAQAATAAIIVVVGVIVIDAIGATIATRIGNIEKGTLQ